MTDHPIRSLPGITPTHLFQFAIQPLWIWYDSFGDPAKKKPLSPFATKLIEDGTIHEKEIVRHLPVTPVETICNAHALDETYDLMKKGTSLIYQGSIECEIDGVLYHGRPDLLKKVSVDSIFGDWGYIPIDIKSSKKVKPNHKHQLMIYKWILEGALQENIGSGEMINRAGDSIVVDLTCPKDHEKTRAMCLKIKDIMGGRKPPINITSTARMSPWFDWMLEEATREDDLSLIYKLDGRAVAELRNIGIHTVKHFEETQPETLPSIPYAPPQKLKHAQLQAKSLVENSVIRVNPPGLVDDTALKLFFDIEGSPWQDVEYLFGFRVVGDANKSFVTDNVHYRVCDDNPDKYFVYFLAEHPSGEKRLWQDFLDWIGILPEQYRVFHYADYERSRLNRLAEKYGDGPFRARFMDKLVDLAKIVQKSVILPLYFYSIKDIAKSKFLGFKWRHEKAGGSQSIFWYEEWLETGDKDILGDIINYNEDDVRATEHLYRWLLAGVTRKS